MDVNQIIHGDALDVLRGLPDASVDAIITDPPYSSGGFSETAKRAAKGQGLRSETLREVGWFINDNMGTAGMVWLMRALACEAARLLVDGGSLLVFCDWRMLTNLAPAMESSGLRYNNLIVWAKNGAGLGVGFRPRHELIMQFVKGTARYYSNYGQNVLDVGRVHAQDKNHQTEKPVDLMEKLIEVVTPIDGMVLDPFAGSGTTLVAARNLQRRYIGVELQAEYVETARKRLSEMYTLPMFEAVGD